MLLLISDANILMDVEVGELIEAVKNDNKLNS